LWPYEREHRPRDVNGANGAVDDVEVEYGGDFALTEEEVPAVEVAVDQPGPKACAGIEIELGKSPLQQCEIMWPDGRAQRLDQVEDLVVEVREGGPDLRKPSRPVTSSPSEPRKTNRSSSRLVTAASTHEFQEAPPVAACHETRPAANRTSDHPASPRPDAASTHPQQEQPKPSWPHRAHRSLDAPNSRQDWTKRWQDRAPRLAAILHIQAVHTASPAAGLVVELHGVTCRHGRDS
jgi:hypothetical protein